ncbi:Uncharacterized membrane protein [Myxococcus fulvus]|uniref:Membrane protein n=1 Tax=Myxococcus fulvus TaxID=33 RepID=A0A511T084_MYXFU|nr:DUF2243 domain-containing protein [Myxococcus fulvus]GEN06808.1 membrane protein [Myxococcus fulvus]SEU04685.1 Uncharacterized membrane protein [Myxococcus fulvus]
MSPSQGNEVVGNRRPLLAAALLLGVGMGGFVDGILLHQILQWHNMLASQVPVMDLVSSKVNMFWDGLFHAFTWLTTATGLALLWRAGTRADVPWSGRVLLGGALMGWGLFNVVEGLIDHQFLGLHHVKPGPHQLAWDLGFLAFGVVLLLVGGAWVRAGREHPRARGSRPLRPLHVG